MSTPDERPKLTRPPSIDDEKKRFANWASRSPIFHNSSSEVESSHARRSSAPDSPTGFTHQHEHTARLSMVAPPSSPPSILCSGFFKTTPTKALGALSFLTKKSSPSHKGSVISAPFFPTHASLTDLMLSTDKEKEKEREHSSNSPVSVNNSLPSTSGLDTTRSPTSSVSAVSSGSTSISSTSISSTSISSTSISSTSVSSSSSNSNPINTSSSSMNGTILHSIKIGSSSAGPILVGNSNTNSTSSASGMGSGPGAGSGSGAASGSLKLSAELALFRKNQYMMNRKVSNSDVRK